MHASKLFVALLTAFSAVPAFAADAAPAPTYTLTSNIGLVSDYVFRGISQNTGKPAIQGGMDYARANGFYAGLWGSNISWITGSGATGDVSLEMDTYLGYRNSFATDFTYDVGFVRYNYIGTYTPPTSTSTTPNFAYAKADTQELYGAIGYKWLTAKYSRSTGDFLTVPNASGTGYLEANASYALPDTGITLGAHYGKQSYKGTEADLLKASGADPSYADYKLSVTKDFGGYVVGLAYSDTNAPFGGYYTYTSTSGVKKDWARAATAVSVTHSF